MGKLKWTYEKCHEEAMKYSSKQEFKDANRGAHWAAVNNGWLNEWFENKIKPNGHWNVKENCLAEAKKYKTKTDFARGNYTAYSATLRNKWIDECEFEISEYEARSMAKSKPRKWLDRETICAAASECGSRAEFEKRFPGAYVIANKEGWLGELFDSKRVERTYEKFMAIARNCHTRGEVKAVNESFYQKAKEEGWIDECDWIPEHAYVPYKWTDDKRWEAALQCKSRGEYMEKFVGAYTYDRKHGLLDRYIHFQRPIPEGRDPEATDYVIYVYEDKKNKFAYIGLTYEERKKKRHDEHRLGRYDKDGNKVFDAVAKHFQFIGEELPEPIYLVENLHINEVGDYEADYIKKYMAEGWKILNIAPAGSLGGAKVKWTYETCKEDSHKYDTRSEWKRGNGPAYYKATNNYIDGVKWIDTFTWLRNSHEVRSEASRKRQTGKKLTEEHKKNISSSLKKFYSKAA